ncbi:MAG TPA: GNAT family N-acetyltransferase [Povalibacter sp.]|nr:GNAT family N-acetyltransferase [Povalibacter sp.]
MGIRSSPDVVLVKEFTIRTALVGEKPQLEALQWRASLNNPGDREALLANPDAIAIPEGQIAGGWMFVARAGDAIVGFAAILPRADGDTQLDALFVEPDLQRLGIGRGLMDHCAQVAKAHGSKAIHVVGNLHAADFYRSCGFQLCGTEQTRFGPGLLMCRQLWPS